MFCSRGPIVELNRSFFRHMVVSSTTAAVLGLTSPTLGGMIYSTTAVPYLIGLLDCFTLTTGASMRFVFGGYPHYRLAIVEIANLLAEMQILFHFHLR